MSEITLNTYEEIIRTFEDPGAVNLSYIADSIKTSESLLTPDQLTDISHSVGGYIAGCVGRGQLKDLEGLDRILETVGPVKMSLSEKDMKSVRFYQQNVSPENIEKLLLRFFGGELTDAVYSLSHPKGYYKDISEDKEKRMMAAVDYVNELLPDTEVTENTVLEIRKYGEMLQIMNARHHHLYEISPNLIIALATVFEKTFTAELTGSRNIINYSDTILLK